MRFTFREGTRSRFKYAKLCKSWVLPCVPACRRDSDRSEFLNKQPLMQLGRAPFVLWASKKSCMKSPWSSCMNHPFRWDDSRLSFKVDVQLWITSRYHAGRGKECWSRCYEEQSMLEELVTLEDTRQTGDIGCIRSSKPWPFAPSGLWSPHP